ncbi:hypothetical protein SB719_01845 [Pantoea sp. SIMBA_079]|uniref:hypothetical protein n=1 Tax=Pantoea sp. SIMBA_079 TaxID=3085817 RepID=UPI003994E92E
MAAQLDGVSKQILGTLLADFTDRSLTISELKHGYEGPKMDALATAVCNAEDYTKVDFDVAIGELEKAKLLRTGPRVFHENKPGSSVIFVGTYSKKEYACLTEAGYKISRLAPNKPPRVNRVINHVTISGGNFTNLQLSAGENINQSMTSTVNSESENVARLISILEEQGVVVDENSKQLVINAVAEAQEGNAGSAKALIAKACGDAWANVQPLAWGILGDMVRKSLGL